MIEEIKNQVFILLETDKSGHGIEHVNSVLDISLRFAEIEGADKDIVALIALLHDVDDYKLFGKEAADDVKNAKKILENFPIADGVKESVLSAIKTIGYNKRLNGIYPTTLEAKVVADADMCDGIGITGILRSYQYNLSHDNVFFDRNIYPILNMSADDYMNKKIETVVTHIFEKQLNIKNLMLTNSGKKEAIKRHNTMVEFLYHLFEEKNVPEWTDYLNEYLNKNSNT